MKKYFMGSIGWYDQNDTCSTFITLIGNHSSKIPILYINIKYICLMLHNIIRYTYHEQMSPKLRDCSTRCSTSLYYYVHLYNVIYFFYVTFIIYAFYWSVRFTK